MLSLKKKNTHTQNSHCRKTSPRKNHAVINHVVFLLGKTHHIEIMQQSTIMPCYHCKKTHTHKIYTAENTAHRNYAAISHVVFSLKKPQHIEIMQQSTIMPCFHCKISNTHTHETRTAEKQNIEIMQQSAMSCFTAKNTSHRNYAAINHHAVLSLQKNTHSTKKSCSNQPCRVFTAKTKANRNYAAINHYAVFSLQNIKHTQNLHYNTHTHTQHALQPNSTWKLCSNQPCRVFTAKNTAHRNYAAINHHAVFSLQNIKHTQNLHCNTHTHTRNTHCSQTAHGNYAAISHFVLSLQKT